MRPGDVAVGPDEQRGGRSGLSHAAGGEDAHPASPAGDRPGDLEVRRKIEQNAPGRSHQLGDPGAAAGGLQREIRMARGQSEGAAAAPDRAGAAAACHCLF
jgi:hypothetical protein